MGHRVLGGPGNETAPRRHRGRWTSSSAKRELRARFSAVGSHRGRGSEPAARTQGARFWGRRGLGGEGRGRQKDQAWGRRRGRGKVGWAPARGGSRLGVRGRPGRVSEGQSPALCGCVSERPAPLTSSALGCGWRKGQRDSVISLSRVVSNYVPLAGEESVNCAFLQKCPWLGHTGFQFTGGCKLCGR